MDSEDDDINSLFMESEDNIPEKNCHKKINFEVAPFNYIVEYSASYINGNEKTDSLNITCIHSEEYYMWTASISDYICSEKMVVDLTITRNMTISPELLFILFKEFSNGTLDPVYEFQFPNGYEKKSSSLPIIILNKMPYEKEACRILFYLYTRKIKESKRFDHKLLRMKKKIENENAEHIKNLKKKIDTLEKKMVATLTKIKIENKNTVTEIDEYLKSEADEYITKTQLKNFIKEFKYELSKLPTKSEMVKYALKTELGNLAATVDLGIFATKKELGSYATKSELKSCATKTELESAFTKLESELLVIEEELDSCATKSELESVLCEIRKTLGLELAEELGLKQFPTEKELESYATKKELESYATKKELESYPILKSIRKTLGLELAEELGLKQFPTEKELESYATKKELESYATKKELESYPILKSIRIASKKKELEPDMTKKYRIGGWVD